MMQTLDKATGFPEGWAIMPGTPMPKSIADLGLTPDRPKFKPVNRAAAIRAEREQRKQAKWLEQEQRHIEACRRVLDQVMALRFERVEDCWYEVMSETQKLLLDFEWQRMSRVVYDAPIREGDFLADHFERWGFDLWLREQGIRGGSKERRDRLYDTYLAQRDADMIVFDEDLDWLKEFQK